MKELFKIYSYLSSRFLDFSILILSKTLLYSVCCKYPVHVVSALLISVDFSGLERFDLFLSFLMNLITHTIARQSFVNDENSSINILNGFSFNSGEPSPATSLSSNNSFVFLNSDSVRDCISISSWSAEAFFHSGHVCCGCTSHSGPCHYTLTSLSSRVDVPRLALSAGFSVVEM